MIIQYLNKFNLLNYEFKGGEMILIKNKNNTFPHIFYKINTNYNFLFKGL